MSSKTSLLHQSNGVHIESPAAESDWWTDAWADEYRYYPAEDGPGLSPHPAPSEDAQWVADQSTGGAPVGATVPAEPLLPLGEWVAAQASWYRWLAESEPFGLHGDDDAFYSLVADAIARLAGSIAHLRVTTPEGYCDVPWTVIERANLLAIRSVRPMERRSPLARRVDVEIERFRALKSEAGYLVACQLARLAADAESFESPDVATHLDNQAAWRVALAAGRRNPTP